MESRQTKQGNKEQGKKKKSNKKETRIPTKQITSRK